MHVVPVLVQICDIDVLVDKFPYLVVHRVVIRIRERVGSVDVIYLTQIEILVNHNTVNYLIIFIIKPSADRCLSRSEMSSSSYGCPSDEITLMYFILYGSMSITSFVSLK